MVYAVEASKMAKYAQVLVDSNPGRLKSSQMQTPALSSSPSAFTDAFESVVQRADLS